MSADEMLKRAGIDFAETTVITDGSRAQTSDATLHVSKYTNELQRLRTESAV